MHELGTCESVVAVIEQRAAGRRVARVGVRAGTLLRVVPDAFAMSFEMVSAGTVAEGAATEVEIAPLSAACRRCATTFETLDAQPACPACGSVDLDRDGGDELILTFIEYREPAAEGVT